MVVAEVLTVTDSIFVLPIETAPVVVPVAILVGFVPLSKLRSNGSPAKETLPKPIPVILPSDSNVICGVFAALPIAIVPVDVPVLIEVLNAPAALLI